MSTSGCDLGNSSDDGMEDKQEPKNTESHHDFYVYCVSSPFKYYYYFAFPFQFCLLSFLFFPNTQILEIC